MKFTDIQGLSRLGITFSFPYLSLEIKTFPSVRLIEVCKNCAMFVNDEFNIQRVRLLCTVIKFHVFVETKEAKEAVLYFAQDF